MCCRIEVALASGRASFFVILRRLGAAGLVVMLTCMGACRSEHTATRDGGDAHDAVNSLGMEFKKIPSGSFTMGSEVHQPAHEVTLKKDFFIGVFEVTQEQYKEVMGSNPSVFIGDNRPVESVTWAEAKVFCRQLSKLPDEVAAGRVYRLPTEAEWEYCCRAGTDSKFHCGDSPAALSQYAWLRDNSQSQTHAVGQKKANDWGLHDTNGNVWEWCDDWFGQYQDGPAIDPKNTREGRGRVARGGGWDDYEYQCQSAYRIWCEPLVRSSGLGFRVVMMESAPGKSK